MEIPCEILLHIFQFLDVKDLCQVIRCSKLLQQAGSDDFLWEKFYRSVFPRCAFFEVGSYYSLFCQKHFVLQDVKERVRQSQLKTWDEIHTTVDLPHADFADFCLKNKKLNCGQQFALKEVRSSALFNFVVKEWKRVLKDPENTSLEYGAFLIASMLCCDDNVISDGTRRLNRLSEEFGVHLEHLNEEDLSEMKRNRQFEIVRQLCIFLKDHKEIGGAHPTSYYNPENSFLHYVVKEKGTGIPITLTILVKAILARHDIHVDLLNTPGHLVGRIRGTHYILDAFSYNTMPSHFYENRWTKEELSTPASNQQIWTRMLNNLILIYERNKTAEYFKCIAQVVALFNIICYMTKNFFFGF